MENEPNPHKTNDEILTEAECALRFRVTRQTMHRWRRLAPPEIPIPYVPVGQGPKPDIRYVWADALAWFRARSRNLAPAPRKPGRPKNVERGPDRDDGRSA